MDRRTWVLRAGLLTTALLTGDVLLPSAMAGAHTDLVSSRPAAGERLDEVPSHVVLEFDEPVGAGASSVRVTDPGGQDRAQAVLLSYDARAVSVLLAPAGTGGEWQISYEVRGSDGHSISGGLEFGVDDPAANGGASLPGVPATITVGAAVASALLVLRGWARRRASVPP